MASPTADESDVAGIRANRMEYNVIVVAVLPERLNDSSVIRTWRRKSFIERAQVDGLLFSVRLCKELPKVVADLARRHFVEYNGFRSGRVVQGGDFNTKERVE